MQLVSIKHNKQIIDSGLACGFKSNINILLKIFIGNLLLGPNSATGEDVVEFSLHGSMAVIESMKKLLQSFSVFGVREAEKGEFSKRYIN